MEDAAGLSAGVGTGSKVRSRARFVLALALSGLGIAWLITLVTATSLGPLTAGASPLELILPAGIGSQRDMLQLQITLDDPARQEVRGTIVWNTGTRLARYPLIIQSGDHAYRYRLPLGTHLDWPPPSRRLTVHLPQTAIMPPSLEGMLLRRSPAALDVPLMRLLLRVFPELPPWHGVLVLCAALLCLAIALIWPWGSLQRRVWVALGGLALALMLMTARGQWAIVRRFAPIARLPEDQAIAHVLHYDAPAAINAALVVARTRLATSERVLVVDGPEGYLLYRARYLLYPRTVEAIDAAPAQLRALLDHYDALLVMQPLPRPPLAGWRLEHAQDGVQFWRRNALMTAVASPPSGSLYGLIAAAGVVLLAGLGAGSALLRPAAPWPERLTLGLFLGILLLALWMVLLSQAGAYWSRSSIGGPLVGAGVLGLWLGRGHLRRPRLRRPNLVSTGCIVVILVQVGYVAWLSQVLPFDDQDSWTTWAFKARAWAIDRALQPALTLYHPQPLHHPAYPPALPLLMSWGFLAQGGLGERLVKSLFPLLFFTLLVLCYAACRRRASQQTALLLTTWLAGTPLLLEHATLGNADLALTAALLAMSLPLLDWIDGGSRRDLLLATLLGGSAAWLKLDGLFLALLLLAAAMAGRIRLAGVRPATAGVAAMVGVIAVYLPWFWLTRHLDLAGESLGGSLHYLGRGIGIVAEELLVSHNNSTWSPLGGRYDLVWPAILIGGVLGARAVWRDSGLFALALAVIGSLLLYILLYALRPYFSIERYLMHTMPLGVVMLAGLAGDQLKLNLDLKDNGTL